MRWIFLIGSKQRFAERVFHPFCAPGITNHGSLLTNHEFLFDTNKPLKITILLSAPLKTKEKQFSIQYKFALREIGLPMPLAPHRESPHLCASTTGAAGGTTGWCPSSFPVIIALRICAKISVKVFGVCGIKIVFVWSFAATSFNVSKYCVISTSCITSCGVEPGTVLAKSSTESFPPAIIALRWFA